MDQDLEPLVKELSLRVAELELRVACLVALADDLAKKTSIPVTIRGPGGWSVKGRGQYVVTLAILTVVGLAIYLCK